jgi:NADPH2:quinone reductase
MKAVICKQAGLPDTLVVEDIPSPHAGRDEVVLTVKAAAVNFPDYLMLQGKHQTRPEWPFTPGWEVAGGVKEIGPGVTGIQIGDHAVAQIKWGGYAEEALVPVNRYWAIPKEIDFVSAAAFPLAYGTSYHALKDRAHLQPGETLLVLGAAGGVGIAAVQFGKLMGARVIACASSAEKLAICKAHGADELVNYSSEDLREAIKRLTDGKGVDVVLDPVGGSYAEPAVRGMAWGGRYLVVGFTGGSIPKIPLNLVLLKGCALVGVAWHTFADRDPKTGLETFNDMARWIARGELKPLVSATYPLERAGEALQVVVDRKVIGKIVLTMA